MIGGAAMENFEAKNPDFAEAVCDSFAGQGVKEMLGASLGDVRPGYCEVHVPFRAGSASGKASSTVASLPPSVTRRAIVPR